MPGLHLNNIGFNYRRTQFGATNYEELLLYLIELLLINCNCDGERTYGRVIPPPEKFVLDAFEMYVAVILME